MRRIDKEIYMALDENRICKAARLADAVGYWNKVYDGDAENGMCAPEFGFTKKKPDIGEDFYGRNI